MLGTIFINPHTMAIKWVVYSHHNPVKMAWVGYCEARNLSNYPDAWKNKNWKAVCSNDSQIFTVIEKLCDDRGEAEFHANQLIKQHDPVCNRQYFETTKRNSGLVQCVQTGKIYGNASTAARAINAAPAQMSQHLKGTPGYRTVAGYTFQRV